MSADATPTEVLRVNPVYWDVARPLPAAGPARPRPRGTHVVQVDAVIFTAACPACGQDADWSEQREDTRTRVVISCRTCEPPATALDLSELPASA